MFDLGFLLGFLLGFFGDLSVFKVAFSSSPDLVGEFDDHAQFRPFLLLGQDIAFLGRGEAALRRQAELLERSEFARFLDAALDGVLLLERAALGGDGAQTNALLALRQRATSR